MIHKQILSVWGNRCDIRPLIWAATSNSTVMADFHQWWVWFWRLWKDKDIAMTCERTFGLHTLHNQNIVQWPSRSRSSPSSCPRPTLCSLNRSSGLAGLCGAGCIVQSINLCSHFTLFNNQNAIVIVGWFLAQLGRKAIGLLNLIAVATWE